MSHVDTTLIDSYLGKDLREFYHELTVLLESRSIAAASLLTSTDDIKRTIAVEAGYVTHVITKGVIAPLYNLYPAITVLGAFTKKPSKENPHTLKTPLVKEYLTQFGLHNDYSELAGEKPEKLIAKVKDILLDLKPILTNVKDLYHQNPPDLIKQAKELCEELLLKKSEDMTELGFICRGLASAADIRPIDPAP